MSPVHLCTPGMAGAEESGGSGSSTEAERSDKIKGDLEKPNMWDNVPLLLTSASGQLTRLSLGARLSLGTEAWRSPAEAPEEPAQDVLGPDDVVCDSCIENPRRALKSCLTCLVSYCQAHLRPHLENPKFQSHRLVEPLRDIERRTCEAHRRPLEFYCRADACCVCSDCAAEEHRGHKTAPVRDARREIEKELSNKQREMLKTMTAAENAINKLQTNTVSIAVSHRFPPAIFTEGALPGLTAINGACVSP
ncbi:hypothetical protein ANANG_G00028300 [Anguilla anguilla]|uniref:B box-type domain-containing protein n=1 Tax=Anguilla anguilla TaxID=7936 RepID=A0A9D3MTJ5_ANGAN|nr:hypothetical protein ANANG_G00028300 [Anguilla anguilla]